MPKKNTRNTKGKIISAAWKLFYENGYDETTVEDIIFASGTSRGSFYHYFDGKDALLGTLAYVFDEKYEKVSPDDTPLMMSNVYSSRSFDVKTPDVVIKVKPDRTDLVNEKEVDGRDCLVIELNGEVVVNGINVRN